MKKSFCTIVFSVFAAVLFAQENEGQKVKTKPEKVTFDFNLKFSKEQATADFSNLVIVEVKTERGRDMDFAKLMKQLSIRSGSISKYCLGLIALHQPIKFNTFKPIYRRFAALNQAS